MNTDYRPGFHYHKDNSHCMPFDPNGATYYKGKYHLFYIFQNDKKEHCFGHITSIDLLNWEEHKTLEPSGKYEGEGFFSGGAFIGPDDRPWIMYHMTGNGNSIIRPKDDDLIEWEYIENTPIVKIPSKEENLPYSSWDPHPFVKDGIYYAIFGGAECNLFKSDDAINWDYVGPFVKIEDRLNEKYEDYSCPDYFEDNGVGVFMFISHTRGWQALIGDFNGEYFKPSKHVRINKSGCVDFAGESMTDNKGRRLLWTWVVPAMDRNSVDDMGWLGVMSLPRPVCYKDGELNITFAEEILKLHKDETHTLTTSDNIKNEISNMCHINLSTKCKDLKLEIGNNNNEKFYITFNKKTGQLMLDMSKSTKRDDVYYSPHILMTLDRNTDRAIKNTINRIKNENWVYGIDEEIKKTGLSPKSYTNMSLNDDDSLELDIFIDRSVIEIYANNKECFIQRFYPETFDGLYCMVSNEAKIKENSTIEVKYWEMKSLNIN